MAELDAVRDAAVESCRTVVVAIPVPVEHDQGDAEAVVRIVSGVEATYSIFRVHGARALKRLSRGDEVEVVYES